MNLKLLHERKHFIKPFSQIKVTSIQHSSGYLVQEVNMNAEVKYTI